MEKDNDFAENKGRGLKARVEYLPYDDFAEYDTHRDPNMSEDGRSIRELLDIILRRKWVLIICLIVAVVIAGLKLLTTDPVYKTAAKIQIALENPKITTFQDLIEKGSVEKSESAYKEQYELIKSRSLAKEVINTLRLGSQPEFAEKRKNSRISGDESLIDSFLSKVGVTSSKESSLFLVSFESTDPVLAAKAANTLVDKYIDWTLQKKLDATKAASDYLKKQLERAKVNLEQANKEFNDFAKKEDIVSLDDKLNLTYNQLAELNLSLAKVETEKLSKEALYNASKSGNYKYSPQTSDPAIQQLNQQYSMLKSQYDNLDAIYGDNFPETKQLKAQVSAMKREIDRLVNGSSKSVEEDYKVAVDREKILRQRTEIQKQRAEELNEKTVQYKIYQGAVETNKSIYDNLLQRLKESEVTSAFKASNIQVIDYAPVPLSPFKPNAMLNLLMAVLVGLIAGVFLIFILEHLSSRIIDEDDIKRRFPLLIMGAIPFVKGGNGIQQLEKVVYTNPLSKPSEAFRVIKSSIMYSSSDQSPRSILVTSTQPGEGKTTVATNTALSLSQSGFKVILLDADLRKPRLKDIFMTNGNAEVFLTNGKPDGLSKYLVGKAELQDVINETNVDGLNLIFSGPIQSNPVDFLGSRKMKDLINTLREEYDYVILDGPPVLGVADSLFLSSKVDGILLVTSAGLTEKQGLRNCIESILRVRGRILGIIVNRIEPKLNKHGYDYYSYGYGDDGNSGYGTIEIDTPPLRN